MQVNVARNGVNLGVFELGTLKAMVAEGKLFATDHVYLTKEECWEIIDRVPELRAALFPAGSIPAPPPPSVAQVIPPPPPPMPIISGIQLKNDEKQASSVEGHAKRNTITEFLWRRKWIAYTVITVLVIVIGAFVFSGDHSLNARATTVGLDDSWDRRINGGIKNLEMSINRQDGNVEIRFDYRDDTVLLYRQIPRGFLVRFFDANGNHLTHFTTKERYLEPGIYDLPYEVKILRRQGNVLMYNISTKDAAFAESAEFGFDVQ